MQIASLCLLVDNCVSIHIFILCCDLPCSVVSFLVLLSVEGYASLFIASTLQHERFRHESAYMLHTTIYSRILGRVLKYLIILYVVYGFLQVMWLRQ